MTYKTIVAYLPTPASVPDTMRVVLPLAEINSAHVIGLHARPDVTLAYGTFIGGVHPDIDVRQNQAAEENADATREAFLKASQSATVATEWRCTEVGIAGYEETIYRATRTADLVVIKKPDHDALDAWADLPTNIVIGSGRPVLILPSNRAGTSVGTNVLVAWNGSREAARAAFDAIPFLRDAGRVQVIAINPSRDEQRESLAPAGDLALTLARHGIEAEAKTDIAPEISVPAELLSRAADNGCDLIVMGCYGHSRLRETMFGGATREMMKSMTVPVLMAH